MYNFSLILVSAVRKNILFWYKITTRYYDYTYTNEMKIQSRKNLFLRNTYAFFYTISFQYYPCLFDVKNNEFLKSVIKPAEDSVYFLWQVKQWEENVKRKILYLFHPFFYFFFYVLLKTLIILYLNPIYSWQSIKNNQFVKLLTGTLICKVCFMLFTGLGSEVVG